MFAYLKIVFGIKSRYQLNHVLDALKQQRFYSLLISQHSANEVNWDDCCDRPDVHYHGLVEFMKDEDKIEKLGMVLRHYCIFFNENICNSPVEYLAYITLAPMRIVFKEILNVSNLPRYLQEIAPSMQLDFLRVKREKKMSAIKRNNDVVNIVNFILKSGCNNRNNLVKLLKKNKCLLTSLEKTHFDYVSKTALAISKKIVLNSSISDLNNRLEVSEDYLSPEESVQFVTNWCKFQNLIPKEFAKDLVRCLDKKSGNRNSIFLQGSPNSGKTYLVQSIIDSCIHVGHVSVESTAYTFAWENCVDQRLIVMWEPYFATVNFDQLDQILAGLGTLVYKRNDVVDYLQPTPVIIVTNEYEWAVNPELDAKIRKRFACCYMNLKSFPNVNKKKLHPQWLNILSKTPSKTITTVKTQQNKNICPKRVLQSSRKKKQSDDDENNFVDVTNDSVSGQILKEQILPVNATEGLQKMMQQNDGHNKRPVKNDAYNEKKQKCSY